MSESNSLVKLFNDIMKGMDDDDEKKAEQFSPEGVPAMIARPPEPPSGRPLTSEYVDTGVPHFETRLNDPNRGIIQPDGRMGTHQMRAEIDPATGKMTAFPMIVDMPGLDRLHQFQDPGAALDYNKSLNNVKVFDDPQKGIDYAKGGYKKGTALAPEEQQQFSQQFGDVPLMGEVPVVEQVSEPVPVVEQVSEPVPSVETVPAEDEGFGISDLFKSAPPTYANKGFTDTIVSEEFRDKLGELGEWAKENPTEAAAAGLTVIPVVRVGGMLGTAAANTLSKINMGKLPNKFKNFFVKTKTTKSGTTKVQRPGQPGKYDPVKVTTKEVNVPRVATAGAATLYAAGEAGDALFPEQEQKVPSIQSQVVASNQAVVDPNNQEAKSLVDAEVDKLLEEGLPRGMIGDDGSLEFEGPVDPDKLETGGDTGTGDKKVKDPKQGFLSKLWNGVKDVITEQLQDPANQRALFAYAVSRALGYDGVTFATQVLADSYEAKAAQQKQDHERQQKILDKELDFKYDMMGKVFDAKLEGNLKAGEKKSKVFYAIETRAKNARENAIKNAISANPNLDEKEVEKRLNNVLNGSTIYNAVVSIIDQYGDTPGFSEFTIAPAIEAGVASFAQQVAVGKAKAADLVAHFEFQRLALSQTPAVSANLSTVHDSEEIVSNDEWSRASGQVSRITGRLELQMQNQSGVGGKANKAKVWSALEREYNRQIQERGDNFAKYWQNISKQSLTKNGRQTSPALAWINSIGKPGDVAEPQFYPGDYNTVINNMFGKR